PPFSGRVLEAIKKAKDDDRVKGVLLAVDSPGGLVTDSHHIYHRLRELSVLKPVVVSMGSMAASGGYYVSMGAGPETKIFAEPTTWTGSIGVIIPHYEVAGLAEKLGVEAAPLKTGEFKDALSPFRAMTERDREVWNAILDQSFQQFIDVIDVNRPGLERQRVQELATGQIYTAQDALQSGLIDAIGYEEDALDELKRKTGLPKARIVAYSHAAGVLDLLLNSAKATDRSASWQSLLDTTVPRAMYFCSWGLPLPTLDRNP
ncbi:MAG: signal peptide peptidase SppA, partial [Planctomycetaceae bacterium]